MTLLEQKEELMRQLLTECLKGPDYHLRGAVIQRRKDNPGMKSEARIIKRYTFNTIDDFEYYKEEIQEYVKLFNARFYINPTPRSYSAVALDVLEKIANLLVHKNHEAIKNVYDSTADSNTGVKASRLWLIDIDATEDPKTSWMAELIMFLYGSIPSTETILISPTPNGYHILVPPHKRESHFIKELEQKHNVEISYKINSATLIYWKGLLENGL